MKDAWFRLLVIWYRLIGSTPTQAEWRARQALGAPSRAKAEVHGHIARAQDTRFKCVCGQLLIKEDRICTACGRRQYVPMWLRRFARTLGIGQVGDKAGTTLAVITMLIGFAAQLRYGGEGAFMSGGSGLMELGAALPELVLGAQPWRAFTYTMLHGGIMHLAFNGIALFQIGPMVERWVGFSRFWFAWVAAGVAGVVIPPLLGYSHEVIVVGASGAVSGLIGMAMVLGHQNGTAQGIALRNGMIKWMIYITVFGFMLGSVAHDAHFAGFGMGALVAWALPPAGRIVHRRRITPVLATVGLAVPIAAIAAFSLWFFQPEAARFEGMMPGAQRVVLQELRLDRPSGDELEALVDRSVALTLDLGRGLRASYVMALQERLPPQAMPRFNGRVAVLIRANEIPGLVLR